MALDPRPRRTQRKLVGALLELTARDGTVPTVRAIADHAAVSRSAFYDHFTDVDDLLASTLDDALAAIAGVGRVVRTSGLVGGDDATRLDLDSLVQHVVDRHALYSVLFEHDSGRLRHTFGVVLGRHLRDGFEMPGAHASASPLLRDVTATGVGHGITAVLADWTTGRLECSRAELVSALAALFPEWTHALKRLRPHDTPHRKQHP